ncbi:MAG: YhjD/YihY/BrkB family envelope integrity protein [Cyanobacteriota bacterium]|nr:YhjD/YihY/BrkB family envelope integrity protein [Cyanobacteriota bacterium]
MVTPRALIRFSSRRQFLVFWRSYRLWLRLDCVDLSAAFAYHLLQSVFPILLIALAIAARLLGQQTELQESLIELFARVLPESAVPLLRTTFFRLARQGLGAGILGGVVLALTASNAYLTLQRGADRIWWNRPAGFEGLTWRQLVGRYFWLRIKALGLVAICALLAVIDQLFSNIRSVGPSAVRQWLISLLPNDSIWPEPVSVGLDLVMSLMLAFLASLLVLWLLPSRRIALWPLVPGALLMSVTLTTLNVLLGRVLFALGLRFQAYGVVGGVLLLTLWVWLVAAVLYYAQCLCFTLQLSRRDPSFSSGLRR